jgi:hypothetical protein
MELIHSLSKTLIIRSASCFQTVSPTEHVVPTKGSPFPEIPSSFRNCPDPVYLHIIYDQLADVIVHRLLLICLTPRWSPQPIPGLNVTQIPPGG